jgi:hypothetical protein
MVCQYDVFVPFVVFIFNIHTGAYHIGFLGKSYNGHSHMNVFDII